MQHSKGPWTAELIYDKYFDIVDADGYDVAEEVGLDDADLIAAAPEMLGVLRAMLEVHDEPCWLDHHGLCQTHYLRRNDAGEPECEVELARAAIAKAEGRTHGGR